ncbi:unnamed protein product [Lymnaea stagnalis]|uniref:Apextrin C-terminal domain-containing protein n=1 Tax=Lymnaea stagnalis TaxID=6523 RepID=A0AAV2H8B7_LYMST
MWSSVSVTFLSLALVASCQASFLMTVMPYKVEMGITENVTILCSYWGQSSFSSLEKISMIRILHQRDAEPFTVVAEVRDNENTAHAVSLDSSVAVKGHIGTVAGSRIELTWPLATSSVFGRYRCDVIGFDSSQDVITEKSPIINITETAVTATDVLELVIKERQDLQNYCDAKVLASENKFAALLNNLKAEQAAETNIIEAGLKAEIAELRADVARLMDTGVLQYWPEGTFALLSPQTGCPNNVGAIWAVGFRKFHTESTDRNYDQVTTNSHLKTPILERVGTNNFMYQHFCVSSTLSPGAAWPRGSYCINRKGDHCPSGFDTGSISWNEERTGSAATTTGVLPDGVFAAASSKLFYCCRNDSSTNDAIYLPKARPFYLYRFQGACQQVAGMKVTPEFMQFDTDTTNTDAYDNDYHPDGHINDVRIELCYYEERI